VDDEQEKIRSKSYKIDERIAERMYNINTSDIITIVYIFILLFN